MKNNRKGMWIPQEIIENTELDWINKILLNEIISLSKLEKGCYASNQILADFLGIKRQSIHRRIKFLIENEYIITQNKYSGEKCVGRIITPTGKLLNLIVEADDSSMEAHASGMEAYADTLEAHADTYDSTCLHSMTAQSDPINTLINSDINSVINSEIKPDINSELKQKSKYEILLEENDSKYDKKWEEDIAINPPSTKEKNIEIFKVENCI